MEKDAADNVAGDATEMDDEMEAAEEDNGAEEAEEDVAEDAAEMDDDMADAEEDAEDDADEDAVEIDDDMEDKEADDEGVEVATVETEEEGQGKAVDGGKGSAGTEGLYKAISAKQA